ncbi:hypothetical protein C6366_05150 [Desulfonatronum sp. SC1]|nr:hypothetical protein C6366_05150 [Desulfonatronum sp. SC1]
MPSPESRAGAPASRKVSRYLARCMESKSSSPDWGVVFISAMIKTRSQVTILRCPRRFTAWLMDVILLGKPTPGELMYRNKR